MVRRIDEASKMSPFTQNRVSRTIWPWPEANRASARAPRPAWRRALLQAFIMAVVAGVLWKTAHGPARVALSGLLATLAAMVLAIGIFLPGRYFALTRGIRAVAHGLGVGMTWLLLVPFFYVCFGLGGWLSRRSGKDPLRREFPTGAKSYWLARPAGESGNSYRRQH